MATSLSTSAVPTSGYHQYNQASSAVDSFIELDNYVHNCSILKHKIPPSVVGHGIVEMFYVPFQIMSVNEVDQTVSVAGIVYFFWFMPLCIWEPNDFNGLYYIDLDSEKIWKPTIGMPKGKTLAVIDTPVTAQLSFVGNVTVSIPGHFDTACDLDLTQYPFDVQNCSIIFVEMHGLDLVSVTPHQIPDLQTNFGTSAEWDLLENNCSVIYNIENNYTYVECWFTISRKSLFHVTTMLIPLISMSVMTLLVFRIPAESGEKMSFVVAIFVSMSVFINLLVGVIPRSMEQMPKGVVCVVAVIIKTGLAACATTVVLRKYESEKTEYILTSINRRPKEEIKNTRPTTIKDKLASGTEQTQLERLAADLPEMIREGNCTDSKQFCMQRLRANKVGDSASVTGNFEVKTGGPLLNDSTASGETWLLIPCKTSWLSHSQLDNLFFVMFALATVVLYLYVLVF